MTLAAADDDSPLPFWRQRPRPIGFEIAYRLKGDMLEIDSTRKVDQVRLSAVEQVRFIYAPSNVSSKGFRTQLRLSDGRTISFGNLSWRSLTDIDRDDARYHAFVTALSTAIVRANPKARFLAGKPYLLWLALVIAGGGAMLMLTFFSLRALQQGATAAAARWSIRRSPPCARSRPRPNRSPRSPASSTRSPSKPTCWR